MMKKIGMKKMVSIVVVIMLFVMFVLMVWCVLVLVFVLMMSGSMLNMNVSEVMRMGCSCMWVVLSMVFMRLCFCVCRFFVNLMIKMVFFVDRLIVVSSFILK